MKTLQRVTGREDGGKEGLSHKKKQGNGGDEKWMEGRVQLGGVLMEKRELQSGL